MYDYAHCYWASLTDADTLKTPTTWSHVEVSVALISACLPTMRPLLTSFLGVIGLNSNNNSHGKASEYSEGQPASRQMKPKKKPHDTALTDFSVLDEGRDGWETPKHGSTDEVPLHGIQIEKEYEQKVETESTIDNAGWIDDRRRKSWYPGGPK